MGKTHGMSFSKPHRIWINIKTRCYNQNVRSYKNYGARGIKMCDSWKNSFEEFWKDMGATYEDGIQIERINVDGDYCFENCTWVSPKQQSRNKTNNRIIDTPLGKMTLGEASEKSGLSAPTLFYRLKRGYTPDILFVRSWGLYIKKA